MNQKPRVVSVPLGQRSYEIEIARGSLAQLGRFVGERTDFAHAVLVTDSNVESPHAATAAESLSEAGATVDVLVIEPGEASKSIETADALWRQLLELGTDRQSIVVAVGGGVVGDLAGFVAATYARGIRLVQVPTTLLAQVDSSVGGKVGVNLPGAKNMVGAFWQPAGVWIDVDTLETLPPREYTAGLAEVVKYGVILDAEFFDRLESGVTKLRERDPEMLCETIAHCCRLKADIASADERELTGSRAVLNYGHTVGHALEAATDYGTLLHGEAVAVGMIVASRLA
jgi:3-dehydroquinate synthase